MVQLRLQVTGIQCLLRRHDVWLSTYRSFLCLTNPGDAGRFVHLVKQVRSTETVGEEGLQHLNSLDGTIVNARISSPIGARWVLCSVASAKSLESNMPSLFWGGYLEESQVFAFGNPKHCCLDEKTVILAVKKTQHSQRMASEVALWLSAKRRILWISIATASGAKMSSIILQSLNTNFK